MRSDTAIRKRIRSLLASELDRRVKEASLRRPHLCVFNHRQPLDVRKTTDGDVNDNYNRVTSRPWEPVGYTLGLCMYGQSDPDAWGGNICEDDIDAQRCPLFEPVKTKEEILGEFLDHLKTPGWVESNLPSVTELLWVLQESELPEVPWWKRLWYRWILRIRVEPRKSLPGPAILHAKDLLLLEKENPK